MRKRLRDTFNESKADMRLIGPFYGEVIEASDPKKEGRITVRVPELFSGQKFENVPPFAMPAHAHEIPQKGQFTKICFRALDIDQPYWEGCWWPTDRRTPSADGDNNQVVKEFVNEQNKALYTQNYVRGEKIEIVIRDDNDQNNEAFRLEYINDQKLIIRVTKAGSYIEIDEQTGVVSIQSDKSPDGADSAPVVINTDTILGQPSARKFDKVIVMDPFTSAPIMQGLIMEGTQRVKLDPTKAV